MQQPPPESCCVFIQVLFPVAVFDVGDEYSNLRGLDPIIRQQVGDCLGQRQAPVGKVPHHVGLLE